jgi:hypothetical protein
MDSIFKSISKKDSSDSRRHALEYADKLAESINFIARTQRLIDAELPAKKLRSTDTVITTAPMRMDGMKSFKMAFNCDSEMPFAVEIIEETK